MWLFFFFFLIPVACYSQQIINAEQFFEIGLSKYQEAEKTSKKNVNFPWIDQYEFRTETRDFDLGQQEYTFRLSPSTTRIRNAQKAYYGEMRNAPDFDGEEIYCDLKLSIHLDWLSLYILNENKNVLDELLVILNDKQSIYQKIVETYDIDPQKLLNLQVEKSDIDICKQKDELNRFRQNKLDSFRQAELNTMGKAPILVLENTKAREHEELSNPTCDVILSDQSIAARAFYNIAD
ncbi:MAG: hypothetical protein R2828_33560 [Saprospiraceae bacterium]